VSGKPKIWYKMVTSFTFPAFNLLIISLCVQLWFISLSSVIIAIIYDCCWNTFRSVPCMKLTCVLWHWLLLTFKLYAGQSVTKFVTWLIAVLIRIHWTNIMCLRTVKISLFVALKVQLTERYSISPWQVCPLSAFSHFTGAVTVSSVNSVGHT